MKVTQIWLSLSLMTTLHASNDAEVYALHDPHDKATLIVQNEHVRKKLHFLIPLINKVQKKIKAFDFDYNRLTVANSFTIKYISELVCGGMQKKKYDHEGKHVWSNAYYPKMRFLLLTEDNTHYTLSNFLNTQADYDIDYLTTLSAVIQHLQKNDINKAILVVDLKQWLINQFGSTWKKKPQDSTFLPIRGVSGRHLTHQRLREIEQKAMFMQCGKIINKN